LVLAQNWELEVRGYALTNILRKYLETITISPANLGRLKPGTIDTTGIEAIGRNLDRFFSLNFLSRIFDEEI